MIKVRIAMIGMLLAGAVTLSAPTMAQETLQRVQPSGGAMIADALIARPLLTAATVGGTAVFLASLPFTALGGNVGSAAEALIKTPAEAAFRRCLGCTVSKRGDEL